MIKIKNFLSVVNFFIITSKCIMLSIKKNSDLSLVKKNWSKEIMKNFNIKLHVKGNPINEESEPCLFIGNHISYLDIPVLIGGYPNITFVSKKEVKYWPLLGNAAIKMKTIFVDRGNSKSKNSAKKQINHALLEKKQKIAIFPSGTTSLLKSSSWKKGAFEIAEELGINVQPFRIRYEPLHLSAFVGNDSLLIHMFSLLNAPQIDVYLEFHEAIKINSAIDDCQYWKGWCENVNS